MHNDDKDLIQMLLDSRASKEAFIRLKQKDWEDKWHLPMGFSDKKKSTLRTIATVLYGENFISTSAPGLLKKEFEKSNEIRSPEYDSLGILANINRLRTFPLIYAHDLKTTTDLGVANKIPVKNFVAVVINKKVKEVPKEVLDVIPKNLPIITTDFRVIRMPKITNNKEKKRRTA